MKRFLLISILACIFGLSAEAQQSIVYSQYLYNGLLINPAYAGSHVQLSTTLSYRNQWVNFEGAPKTSNLSAHTAVAKSKVGLGLIATNDKIGSYANNSVFGTYAYRIRGLRGGVFSMGLQGGIQHFKADYSSLNLKNAQDPTFSGSMSEIKPNFGGGIYYASKKFVAGFSVPVIMKYTKFFNGGLQQLAPARYYYLFTGVILPVDRMEKIKVNPSVLVRMQDGTPLSADFNLNVVLHDVVSGGVSYRLQESVTTLLNFKLSDKFNFGYSHDWITGDIRRFSNGTHEFMLNYRVRLRGVHRNVACPSYFSYQ